MHLSPNFQLQEFEFSDTAIRNGIDNSVPKDLIPNLERLCHYILEPVRKRFGPVRITSGYRCPALNRLVKSRPTSHHVTGQAADFIIVGGSRPLVVCDWIGHEGLPFEQVINEWGRWSHVSISLDGAVPKREALTIDDQGVRAGLHDPRP